MARERYTPWFGLPDGPEKDRLVAREKVLFRVVVFVAVMSVLLGWACQR